MGSGAVGLGGDVGGGVARVAHVSDVARVGIGDVVLDGLDAAVGEGNMVLALGGVAVTGLALAEVGAGVVVLDGVGVLVVGRDLLVGGCGVVGSGRASGGSGGNGQEGREGNEGLE